jgi:hypothetical protein
MPLFLMQYRSNKINHTKSYYTTTLLCYTQKTLQTGGEWTRIFCSSGVCDDHYATPPGHTLDRFEMSTVPSNAFVWF